MSDFFENLLSPEEVLKKYGEKLGTHSVKGLWALRKAGKLGFFRVGKKIFHTPNQIENYIKFHCGYDPKKRTRSKICA